MNLSKIAESLVLDEGFEGMPYKDHLGKDTIGIGTLLPITKEEAMLLLETRLADKIKELLDKKPWIADLPEEVQIVLGNMGYQLGINGLLKFEKMLMALKEGKFTLAASHGLDSRWAKQTPKRAKKLMKIISDIG